MPDAAGRWLGLDEARDAFERSRPREAYEGVPVRLILQVVPPNAAEFPELTGTDFGMQDRAGRLVRGRAGPENEVRFEIGGYARRRRDSGALTFVGPYIHGPSGGEFLYLNWRLPDAPPNTWVWRRKFPLAPITWDAALAAHARGQAFAADGTGRPAHATVPVEWTAVTP